MHLRRCCAGKPGRCDWALRYLEEQECTFDRAQLPQSTLWPAPRSPWFPFDGLTDYLRALGPGVYVGMGWNYRKGKIKRCCFPFLMIRDLSMRIDKACSPS